MPEVTMYMTQPTRPVVAAEERVTLSEAARHALKTAVHHELIRRMDLEKLAAIQADDVVILHFPDTVTPLEAVEWREVFSQLTGITNRVVAFVGDVQVEVKRPEPGQ